MSGQTRPPSAVTIEITPEVDRKRRLLNIMAVSGAITCAIFIALMLIPPISPWYNFVIFGILLGISLVTLVLNRKVYSLAAAWLWLLSLTVAIFANQVLAVVREGAFSPLIYYYALTVLAAGMVLSPRATFGFATLSTVFIASNFFLAGQVGSFQDEAFVVEVIGGTVPPAILCYLMALVAWLYGSSLEGALQQLTERSEELEAANQEIRAFTRTLEDKVEERTHELREFMSMVAHDLRTPLTVISGYAEMLQEEQPTAVDERHERAADLIAANVEHMLDLTDDLLELSRLRSGGVHFDMEALPIELVIKEVCANFEPRVTEKRLGLKTELSPDLPPVWGDPLRLAQVVNNLIWNAFNYTPAGAIIVGARAVDDSVEVSISDTGIGIPPEEQERLFTHFFRGEHELVRSSKGTGLGLSIAHSIVEAHGGEIWVESEVDKGTTFRFTVPVAAGLDL